MEELMSYFLRITPGLVLIAALFFLLPKKQILARIFILILGFILMRDAMTPEGLWRFGISEPAVWLRFIDDAFVLIVVGVLSLGVSIALLSVKELRRLVNWGDVRSWKTYGIGIAVGAAVALPFLLLSSGVPIELRGGAVALMLLPALLFMAMAGNFLEELVFRGFYQSYLAKQMSGTRAAVISGVTFAAAHVFLASTVTSLGWPLLIFVLAEGIACAFVYKKYGLISATIAHGLAIFLLASGLF